MVVLFQVSYYRLGNEENSGEQQMEIDMKHG